MTLIAEKTKKYCFLKALLILVRLAGQLLLFLKSHQGLGELPEELKEFALANSEVTTHILHLGYEHQTAGKILQSFDSRIF